MFVQAMALRLVPTPLSHATQEIAFTTQRVRHQNAVANSSTELACMPSFRWYRFDSSSRTWGLSGAPCTRHILCAVFA